MRRKILFIFLPLLLVGSGLTQVITNFRLQEPPDRDGIVGNSITDLVWFEGILYVGTGYGLSATSDEGQSWENWTPREYGGKGGISALAVAPDGTIWIATGFDSTVNVGGGDQDLQTGGGLRYLPPNSSAWVFIPQPKDSPDDTLNGKKPTTTVIQNITFDIAILDTQVWIASWGGGIRRSQDWGQTWEVITLDGRPFDAGNPENLNQLGFSLLVENGNIWVGTAGGIGKSNDGGETWEVYTHQNQNQAISGNWVIALAYNPYDHSVWAATLKATGETEFNAISKTSNGGLTWDLHLQEELSDGTFPRYIAFYDSAVYVATEKGVYKTVDDGTTWFRFPTIVDAISGEQLLTQRFFSVATAPTEGSFHRLWVGSSEGLATTADNGYSWTIFRSFVSTRQRTNPAVYAYPNPYSPTRDEPVRFQFHITRASRVTVDIFNFALEKVITLETFLESPQQNTFDRSLRWNGLDSNHRMVDNGVYFFRARIGDRISWGKIIIVN